jgi:hypothetical protein
MVSGRKRESRSREAAGRKNQPEAVPRRKSGRKKAGLLKWEDRLGHQPSYVGSYCGAQKDQRSCTIAWVRRWGAIRVVAPRVIGDGCGKCARSARLQVRDRSQWKSPKMVWSTACDDYFRVADSAGIADECKAIRGLQSDRLATEHVLQAYRGSKHSCFAATLCSQLQT